MKGWQENKGGSEFFFDRINGIKKHQTLNIEHRKMNLEGNGELIINIRYKGMPPSRHSGQVGLEI